MLYIYGLCLDRYENSTVMFGTAVTASQSLHMMYLQYENVIRWKDRRIGQIQ